MSVAASTTAPSIADQATDALAGAISAAAAGKLWESVTEEREALAGRLSQAEDAAIDPLVKSDQAIKLRAEADAMQFRLDRLDKLGEALGNRVAQLQKEEATTTVQVEYRAAREERDQLVNEIRNRYPLIVAELVDLAIRLRASNARVTAANSRGVKGEDWLYSAESIARERGEPSYTPTIVASMRLPAAIDSAYLAWPRSSNEVGARQVDTQLRIATDAANARARAATSMKAKAA